jgi:hypothetical protein
MPPPAPPPVGLCDSCRQQQVVRTTRGSVFSLCRRSRDEPERYPRYPQIPVLRCGGYERRSTEPEAEPGP